MFQISLSPASAARHAGLEWIFFLSLPGLATVRVPLHQACSSCTFSYLAEPGDKRRTFAWAMSSRTSRLSQAEVITNLVIASNTHPGTPLTKPVKNLMDGYSFPKRSFKARYFSLSVPMYPADSHKPYDTDLMRTANVHLASNRHRGTGTYALPSLPERQLAFSSSVDLIAARILGRSCSPWRNTDAQNSWKAYSTQHKGKAQPRSRLIPRPIHPRAARSLIPGGPMTWDMEPIIAGRASGNPGAPRSSSSTPTSSSTRGKRSRSSAPTARKKARCSGSSAARRRRTWGTSCSSPAPIRLNLPQVRTSRRRPSCGTSSPPRARRRSGSSGARRPRGVDGPPGRLGRRGRERAHGRYESSTSPGARPQAKQRDRETIRSFNDLGVREPSTKRFGPLRRRSPSPHAARPREREGEGRPPPRRAENH